MNISEKYARKEHPLTITRKKYQSDDEPYQQYDTAKPYKSADKGSLPNILDKWNLLFHSTFLRFTGNFSDKEEGVAKSLN